MTEVVSPRDGDTTTALSVGVEPAEMRRATAWLESSCREQAVPATRIAHLDLCLNEVLANVHMHGGDSARSAPVALQIEIRRRNPACELTLRISDAGVAFDPLAAEEKPRATCLADANPGGLGLAMLRKFTDRIEYRRKGERNHLMLTVCWDSSVTPALAAMSAKPEPVHWMDTVSTAHFGRGADRRHAAIVHQPERRLGGERRLEGIGRLPLFGAVDEAQLAAALVGCEVMTLPAGVPVMRPGDHNEHIYIVLSGHVDVFLDEHRDAATSTPVERGEVFGLISGIDARNTSALVVPKTDVRVIKVRWDVFRNRIVTLPGVAAGLMTNMVERIRRSNTQALAALREHLEFEHLRRELELARQLQANMLPRQRPLFPDRREIAVCGMMEPAAKVGGDLFDTFFVDERHLFFCVGDAAGHGVTAAMVMARTIGLLHLLARNQLPPAELLAALNDRLALGNETGLFVTLLCGLLDVESGQLTYANGGHTAPIIVRGGHAELLPLSKGSVVGAVPNRQFSALESRLEPGDTLVCYTDGLIEARNPSGEPFGVERCLDIAARQSKDGPSHLLDAIYMELYKFTGTDELDDDFTVLGIRRRSAG